MLTWNVTQNQSVYPSYCEITTASTTQSTQSYGAGGAPDYVHETFYITTSAFALLGSTVSANDGVTFSSYTYQQGETNSGTGDNDAGSLPVDSQVNNLASYSVVEVGFSSSSWASSSSAYSTFYDPNFPSSASNSDSSSASSTWEATLNLQTTATATSEYDYTTTTTFASTSSQYTSSSTSASILSSTSTVSTTTFTSATVSVPATFTSNAVWFTSSYDDGYGDTITYTDSSAARSSVAISITTVESTVLTLSSAILIGTVVSAQGEWLWSYTATPSPTATPDGTPYFITAIAESFTQQTFWPVVAQVPVSYSAISDSSTVSYSNADSTTNFTTQAIGIDYADTYSYSLFSGDEFPRATTSTTAYQPTIVTGSFTAGMLGSSGVAAATTTTSVTSVIASTTAETALFKMGLDSTTTTISAAFYVSTAYTFTTAASTYLAFTSYSSTTGTSFSTSAGLTYSSSASYYSEQGISVSSTENLTMEISNGYFSNETSAVFQPVPKNSAFRTPDAMAQTCGLGGNISVNPPIYYPFTSSVQQNVVVPVPTNSTAMQTDTNQFSTNDVTVTYDTAGDTYSYVATVYTNLTSWNYAWNSFSLSYTSATSQTSSSTYSTGTTTGSTSYSVWSSSSSTAALSIESAVSANYWQAGDGSYGEFMYGGYAPISSASELAQLVGGINATSYDTSGATTADAVIRTSLTYSALSETIRVEQTAPVFVTESNAGGGLPVVSFNR